MMAGVGKCRTFSQLPMRDANAFAFKRALPRMVRLTFKSSPLITHQINRAGAGEIYTISGGEARETRRQKSTSAGRHEHSSNNDGYRNRWFAHTMATT
jgi:hypothetical protein